MHIPPVKAFKIMQIATIIPIARGIPFDTLSYYASESLTPGTLVVIPFGKQTIHGIVTETVSIAEAKSMIKSASFTLKKIKSVLGVLPAFEAAALALTDTAALTLTPVGTLAGNVIPQTFFDYINSEKIIADQTETKDLVTSSIKESVSVGPTAERIDHYKRLIRTSFAAKQSIIFTAPTVRSLERYKVLLEKGITNHCILLHSKITKKNLRSAFSTIKSSERPLLIFTTPGFLVFPRADIGTLIAEDESQSLYQTSDRYKSDLRIFIKQYAERMGLQLVWGDTLPRFTTLQRLDADHVARTYIPDKLTVVPVEPYRTVLPVEVIEILRHAQKKGRRLFMYASRKGLAPLSRCSDCGTIVTCTDCSLPMVLRNKTTAEGVFRTFVCTHCTATLPTTHTCTHCGSWNITPSAIGTESLRDAVSDIVGKEYVVTVDDDLTPDSASIQTLLKESDPLKFVVIIGTIKVLPYLKQIHYSLLPFFDRLLSTPSVYTTEQVLRLVMECNERSSEGVLAFSREPNFPFTKQLETQKINAIIHDELTLRSELGYPPFGSIVKINLTVPEGYRQSVTEKVSAFLEGQDSALLPARRISAGSMKVLLSWILTVPTTYIEEEGPVLVTFLQTLRFPYLIEENPERW